MATTFSVRPSAMCAAVRGSARPMLTRSRGTAQVQGGGAPGAAFGASEAPIVRVGRLLPALAFAMAVISAASAQEVRIARQYSMGYLQFNVMEHDRLIEKHARALGLAGVTVSWATFNGPSAMNDALISG